MKISHKLKMKIITNKNLTQTVNEYKQFISCGGFNTSLPQCKEETFIINLQNDLHLLEECINWMNSVRDNMLYIEKSQVNVGCFKGIFPIKLSLDNKVTFSYQIIDTNGESWKDWFVMEEE